MSRLEARRLASRTVACFTLTIFVWSIVWLAKPSLDARFPWLARGAGSALFWLLAKVAIWILPACWLVRLSGNPWGKVLNLRAWRRWAFWGTVVGLLISLTGLFPKWLRGDPLLTPGFDFGTLNVLVVSPLFEEFLTRAALLGNLIPAFGFARANVIAAAWFVVLHVPGWYMMGTLETQFSQPIGGALSIFLLGLCFGWATRKGESFLGGSVAHFLNNLAA